MSATTLNAMDRLLDHASRIGNDNLRGHHADLSGAVILTLRIAAPAVINGQPVPSSYARGTGHTAEHAAEDLLGHITREPTTVHESLALDELDVSLEPLLPVRRQRLANFRMTREYQHAAWTRASGAQPNDIDLECLKRAADLAAAIRELGGTTV